MRDAERNLASLVRVGIVSSIDETKKQARVLFEDVNMVSGWLPVLQRTNEIVKVESSGAHSHSGTDSEGGSISVGSSGSHTHEAKVTTWMPEVGTHVLCLYLPMFNADGFILGEIP